MFVNKPIQIPYIRSTLQNKTGPNTKETPEQQQTTHEDNNNTKSEQTKADKPKTITQSLSK